MMHETQQLSLFDSIAAENYQKEQTEAEMIEWAESHLALRDFKRWKAKYNKEKAWCEQPLPPLRADIQATVDRLFAEIMASVKPYLADEYAMLGLTAGATKRDIKNAYRRQARKLHPDKGGTQEAMKALNAAYKRLLAAAKD